MKRFITYLYEYNNGRKVKNAGFIRVDIRGELVNIEVCVRNHIRTIAKGKLYALVEGEKVLGIELGEIPLQGGVCNKRLTIAKNHISDSPYVLDSVVGMAIDFNKEGYLASCWNDAFAEVIGNGTFSVFKKEEVDMKAEMVEEIVLPVVEEIPLQSSQIQECDKENCSRTFVYKKIDISKIRELPSANWHLDNNSFLKHGVFNYGFLFLKKEIRKDGETLWLGVPGYFEKPELLMAVLFGFPEFEPVPKSVVNMEMNMEYATDINEKNQEPKTGIFGGWFVLLDE